ncbi:MAG: alpha/beta hydrolase [Dehalococcoidia bacterium]|nr:MAG: alpha/beta hydrolase [Dehalococcoidia bacterium]
MKSLYLAEWNTFIRYHEISGKGRTLVYLPGLSMPSVEQFLSVATHADMAGYNTLLIDYIGSGCSDNSEGFDYSIENHVRTIAAVLDSEGAKGCTLIGYSMGGTVGIVLAVLRPDLVSKLIVVEANISPGGGETTRRIASYSESEYVNEAHQIFLEEVRKAEKEGDVTAAFINAAWTKADPSGLYKSSVALVELDETFKEQFQKLSIPRTFIYGEESLPKDRNKVQPDAPDPGELEGFGVQIAIVPNAGHAMMFDNLEGFVHVLKQAIRS